MGHYVLYCSSESGPGDGTEHQRKTRGGGARYRDPPAPSTQAKATLCLLLPVYCCFYRCCCRCLPSFFC